MSAPASNDAQSSSRWPGKHRPPALPRSVPLQDAFAGGSDPAIGGEIDVEHGVLGPGHAVGECRSRFIAVVEILFRMAESRLNLGCAHARLDQNPPGPW